MFLENEALPSLVNELELERSVNHTFSDFGINGLIGIMKRNRQWERGEMNMMVLLKKPTKKILLLVLHENTEITSYQVNTSITFHIMEGELTVHFPDESFHLKKGEMLTRKEKTKFSIDSYKESAFLMNLNS